MESHQYSADDNRIVPLLANLNTRGHGGDERGGGRNGKWSEGGKWRHS